MYSCYYRTLYNDFLSSNEAWLSSVAGRHEYDMQTFSNVALEMGISMDIAAFKLDEQPEKSIPARTIHPINKLTYLFIYQSPQKERGPQR